jgi:hypothetical protein
MCLDAIDLKALSLVCGGYDRRVHTPEGAEAVRQCEADKASGKLVTNENCYHYVGRRMFGS